MRETWQKGEARTYVLPLETFQFPHPLLCKAAYPNLPDMNVFGGHYYLLAAPEHSKVIAPAEMEVKDSYRNTPGGYELDGLKLIHPSGDAMYFEEIVTLNRTGVKQGECFANVIKSRDGNPANAHLHFSFFPRSDYDSEDPNSLFHQLYARRTVEYDAIEATVNEMFKGMELMDVVKKLRQPSYGSTLFTQRVFDQVESLKLREQLLSKDVRPDIYRMSFTESINHLIDSRVSTLRSSNTNENLIGLALTLFGGFTIASAGALLSPTVAFGLAAGMVGISIIKNNPDILDAINSDPTYRGLLSLEARVNQRVLPSRES